MPFLFEAIIGLIIVGFALHLIWEYVPMLKPIKLTLMVVIVIACIYWLAANYHRLALP